MKKHQGFSSGFFAVVTLVAGTVLMALGPQTSLSEENPKGTETSAAAAGPVTSTNFGENTTGAEKKLGTKTASLPTTPRRQARRVAKVV